MAYLLTSTKDKNTIFRFIPSMLWAVVLVFQCNTPLLADQSKVETVMFADVTNACGLSSANPHSYSAAAGDFDRDGFPDLLISHHGPFSLWRNNSNGTFLNASSLIVGRHPADKHGVSFVDLNKDGLIDIAISAGAERGRGEGKNIFLLNEEGRAFTRTTLPNPTIEYDQGRGRSIVPLDFNRDGAVDLLLMNYIIAKKGDPPHRLAINLNHGQSITKWEEHSLSPEFSSTTAFGCSVVNLDNSGRISLILTGPGRNAGKIFQETNDKITDVTQKLGIDQHGCMTVTPIDYDNDGDLDLFYGRGLPPPSSSVGISEGKLKFIINNKEKMICGFNCATKPGKIKIDIRFEQKSNTTYLRLGKNKEIDLQKAPAVFGLMDSALQGEPAIDPTTDFGGFLWRDPQSGVLHYRFVGNDTLQETEGYIQPIDFVITAFERINLPAPIDPQHKNSLYKNEHGHFVDVGQQAQLLGKGQVFTSIAADFNNDGFQDIYAINIGQTFGELNPPNNLFLNNGDGTFNEVSTQSGAIGPTAGIGSGAVALDYDRDGKLDLFLHNGNTIFPQEDGPLVLLRNISNTINRSVQITLTGYQESQGWGTRVYAKLENNTNLLQQKYALNGYLSTSDLPIHIGLGREKNIKKLRIEWPSGKNQYFFNVNTPHLSIKEPH